MKEKRILSGFILVLLVFVNPVISAQSEPAYEAVVSHVSLQIEGMTWGACPVTIRTALEGLKGVKKAEVSFAEKKAVVTYDPQAVDISAMVQAVKRAGFSARAIAQK